MTDGAQTETAQKTIWLAGASGTIGSAVAPTLLADGHRLVCLLSDNASGHATADALYEAGAEFAWNEWPQEKPDTVISCMASRTGAPKDAEEVDFQANLALLERAQECGADHFILLSAICVQRPRLAFQHAKIAFERALKASPIDHTIIRPTAFFKSLSGQVERVEKGGKFMVFGNGELTRCKPISDRDLARFIADSVTDAERRNQTLPIGGPGPALSPNDQLDILAALLGEERQTKRVPLWIFGAAERFFGLGAGASDWCAEKAEYARIARYYATESMLVLDPATGEYSEELTPEFGEDRLSDHYADLLGGAR